MRFPFRVSLTLTLTIALGVTACQTLFHRTDCDRAPDSVKRQECLQRLRAQKPEPGYMRR